jgi:hypothetical protein
MVASLESSTWLADRVRVFVPCSTISNAVVQNTQATARAGTRSGVSIGSEMLVTSPSGMYVEMYIIQPPALLRTGQVPSAGALKFALAQRADSRGN